MVLDSGLSIQTIMIRLGIPTTLHMWQERPQSGRSAVKGKIADFYTKGKGSHVRMVKKTPQEIQRDMAKGKIDPEAKGYGKGKTFDFDPFGRPIGKAQSDNTYKHEHNF